jgi:hypothetical protein
LDFLLPVGAVLFGLCSLRRTPKPQIGGATTADFEQYSYDANGNRTSLRLRSESLVPTSKVMRRR